MINSVDISAFKLRIKYLDVEREEIRALVNYNMIESKAFLRAKDQFKIIIQKLKTFKNSIETLVTIDYIEL